MALTSPPPRALTPERLALLLPQLGFHEPADRFVREVAALVPTVREATSTPSRIRYEVGERVVWAYRDETGFEADLHVDGGWRAPGDPAAHAAALSVVLAWQEPAWKPAFEQSIWELGLRAALDVFIAAPTDAERAAKEPHRGWIQYHVVPAADVPWEWPSGGLMVLRRIVRRSKRDGRPLKSIPCPDQLDRIEARLHGLTDTDLALHHALTELAALTRGRGRYSWQPGKPRTERYAELVRAIVPLLADVEDVQLRDEPIDVSARPLQPRIVAARTPAGMALSWEPVVTEVWEGPAPLVLTVDGVLHALAAHLPAAAAPRLLRPLPDIPERDIGAFVERVVIGAPVHVDLPLAEGEHVVAATSQEFRLFLEERGSLLNVFARACYRVGDREVLVDPEDPGRLARLPEGGARLRRRAAEAGDDRRFPAVSSRPTEGADAGDGGGFVARDLDWERSVSLPTGLLEGDDALDFLADQVPGLRDTVAVYGEADLNRYRYLGAATPSVGVSSKLDWFDLKLAFKAGTHTIPASRILHAWRNDERYVRLADGAVARLPHTWLARHGAAVAELEDMRRGGGLGLHAAPVARDLLDEAGAAEWVEIADRIAAFDRVERRPTPDALRAELRDYQQSGWSWLAAMRDLGLGACLADDMGLGKTIQTLALLCDSHAEAGPPSLVVAPTSVVYGWAREAARFAPHLRVLVFHGADRSEDFDAHDLVLTSYPLLWREAERLGAVRWRHVVLDEAQHIKNPASKVAKAARGLNTGHRIALTGTPLENNLLELWSLFQFLMPGFFGSREAFTRRYVTPARRGSTDALGALRRRVRPFLLRRLKSEVATELPARQEAIVYCELGDGQRALYDEIRADYRASLLGKIDQQGMAGASLHVLEALTRLRQACCDPALLPMDRARGVLGAAKLDVLEAMLAEAIETGHRALVFSQWPSMLQRARERLEALDIPCLYLDGSTKDRQALVERFAEPDAPPVFLISLKAGGTGLNLTAADYVVHLDPWWNPAAEAQATDRAHRIGQTRPVIAWKLVAKDTVEEKILELQDRKRALFHATVDEGRLGPADLTREDLEAVLADR